MQDKTVKRGKGRPATGRVRDTVISFRVSKEEEKAIRQKAKENNQTLVEWILSHV